MPETQRKARIIQTQFGERIDLATAGTIVPPKLVAGIIGNECAFNQKTQRFDESVPRFEPHVYSALISLRDRGFYLTRAGGRKTRYGRVMQSDLAGAPDESVRALASSWGPGQIMGYNAIDFGCTVADLRNPGTSLTYIVRMLIRDAAHYVSHAAWEQVLRIWNAGSPTGKTYSPTYVPQGLAMIAAYGALGAAPAGPGPWATAVPAGAAEPVIEEGGRGHDEDVAATNPVPPPTTEVTQTPTPVQMTEPQQPAPGIFERLRTSTTFLQSAGIQVTSVLGAIGAFFAWPGAPWVIVALLGLGVIGYMGYQWAEKGRKRAEAEAQTKVRQAELEAAARIEEARKNEPSPEQVAALRAQWEAERGLTERRSGARAGAPSRRAARGTKTTTTTTESQE